MHISNALLSAFPARSMGEETVVIALCGLFLGSCRRVQGRTCTVSKIQMVAKKVKTVGFVERGSFRGIVCDRRRPRERDRRASGECEYDRFLEPALSNIEAHI